MSSKSSYKSFRLAFIRRKINSTFYEVGKDAALVVEMVERVRPTTSQPVQVVLPQPNDTPAPAPQPGPAPRPAPVPAPELGRDGSSEESAVEIIDSKDEFIQDMTLSPRREQRLRRQFQIWREDEQ